MNEDALRALVRDTHRAPRRAAGASAGVSRIRH